MIWLYYYYGRLEVKSLNSIDCNIFSFSPLTFDSSLDNVFVNASVIEQPLGHEAYGVHRPGFEPINYVETLRSVYSL